MVLLEVLINYSEVLQKKQEHMLKIWKFCLLEKIDVFAAVCCPQTFISKKTLIDY